jgi:hypothetical protein
LLCVPHVRAIAAPHRGVKSWTSWSGCGAWASESMRCDRLRTVRSLHAGRPYLPEFSDCVATTLGRKKFRGSRHHYEKQPGSTAEEPLSIDSGFASVRSDAGRTSGIDASIHHRPRAADNQEKYRGEGASQGDQQSTLSTSHPWRPMQFFQPSQQRMRQLRPCTVSRDASAKGRKGWNRSALRLSGGLGHQTDLKQASCSLRHTLPALFGHVARGAPKDAAGETKAMAQMKALAKTIKVRI